MRIVSCFVLACIALTALVQPVMAAVVANWNVAGGGSWNVGTNWSPAGTVPTTGEAASFGVILPAGASAVTLDADQSVYGVLIAAGSGKQLTISSGVPSTSKLILTSTDTTSDGVNTFFALSATNGGAHNIAAPVQLGNGSSGSFTATFNSFVNASNFVINGGITESAGQTWGVRIVGNGTGIVNYGTTGKTYSGDTTIANAGILKLNTNNQIPDGAGKGNVVIEGNGALQTNNIDETINGLSSTSSTAVVARLGANSRTLIIGGNNATASFAGNFVNSGTNNSGSLTKTGNGVQTLSGANNTWNGATSVNAGTLLMNGIHNPVTVGTLGAANGYTVASGATLGGTGTINLGTGGTGGNLANSNGVVIQNGGTLAPGASVGTLSINVPLTLNNTSNLNYELDGTNTAVGMGVNDWIQTVTNLTLDGVLNVAAVGSFGGANVGQKWRLINYVTLVADNVLTLGTMPALPPDMAFQIETIANQVNLVIVSNAVPEASAFLFGAVICALLPARRLLKRRDAAK